MIAADPVAAHEGDARLELEPSAVAPGGGVRVLGEDLEPDTEVRVTIEGLDQHAVLESVVVDPAGHFVLEVPLPADLRAGVYGVKVSRPGGELVASNVLVVDSQAGPGVPVDRGPPWPALIAVVLGAIVVLGALRWLSPGHHGRPPAAPGET